MVRQIICVITNRCIVSAPVDTLDLQEQQWDYVIQIFQTVVGGL